MESTVRKANLDDRQAFEGLVKVMLGNSNVDEVAAAVVDDFFKTKCIKCL